MDIYCHEESIIHGILYYEHGLQALCLIHWQLYKALLPFREFPVPSLDVTTKLFLGGNNDVITELFLPRGSLVSAIPAGDGKLLNLFLQCGETRKQKHKQQQSQEHGPFNCKVASNSSDAWNSRDVCNGRDDCNARGTSKSREARNAGTIVDANSRKNIGIRRVNINDEISPTARLKATTEVAKNRRNTRKLRDGCKSRNTIYY